MAGSHGPSGFTLNGVGLFWGCERCLRCVCVCVIRLCGREQSADVSSVARNINLKP